MFVLPLRRRPLFISKFVKKVRRAHDHTCMIHDGFPFNFVPFVLFNALRPR